MIALANQTFVMQTAYMIFIFEPGNGSLIFVWLLSDRLNPD